MSRRLARKEQRELARLLDQEGWTLTAVNGHLHFRHRQTGALMVVSCTPSSRHARAKVLAQARRCLRAREDGRA